MHAAYRNYDGVPARQKAFAGGTLRRAKVCKARDIALAGEAAHRVSPPPTRYVNKPGIGAPPKVRSTGRPSAFFRRNSPPMPNLAYTLAA